MKKKSYIGLATGLNNGRKVRIIRAKYLKNMNGNVES